MQYSVTKEVEQEDGSKKTVIEGVNVENVKYIGGGVNTTYVVTKENKVYGTGLGTSGEIGNLVNNNQVYLTEIKDIDGKTVEELGIEVDKIVGSSIYGNTGYIVASDGSMYGWGLNNYAQLQKVTTIGVYNYLVRLGQVGETIKVVHIIEGENKELNLNSGDLIEGFNIYNQKEATLKYELNNEEENTVATVNESGVVTGVKEGTVKGKVTSTTGFSIELAVVVEKNVAKVVNGENFTVALKEDSSVWAWGNQSNGRLGNGVSADSNIIDPVEVKQGKYETYVTNEETGATATRFVEDKALTDVIDISAGPNFVVALKRDGTVWTWGYNGYGQLGIGRAYNKNDLNMQQVKISEEEYLSNVIDISAGQNFAVAVTKDGKAYAWGLNDNGQLGQGNTTNYSYAMQMQTAQNEYITGIVAASTSQISTSLLKEDGSIYTCGYNSSYVFI